MQQISIVGTVRNVSLTIRKDIKNFQRWIAPHGRAKFFLVESDSSDNTLAILDDLKSLEPAFDYVTLGNLAQHIPDRIDRLIHCRNRYVREIRNNESLKASEVVIVADFDGINTRLSSNSLRDSLSLLASYAVICANQKGRYYDVAALRHKYWSPNNAFLAFDWYKSLYSHSRAKQLAIYSRMIRIPPNAPLIEVDSAFGGLALYKLDVFLKHDYEKNGTGQDGDIDHVILNRKIIESGQKIAINPTLINSNWNSHNLGSFAFLRFLRYRLNKVRNKT